MLYKITPKTDLIFYAEGNDPAEALAKCALMTDLDITRHFKAEAYTPDKTAPWKITKVAYGDHGFDTVEFGELNFGAESVIVTDPCYNSDVQCREIVPMLPGAYICVAHFSDDGDWGIRVAKIGIYRSTQVLEEMMEGMYFRIGSIGVDAGLAGFFEKKPDFTDEQWHDFCNDIRSGDAWIIDGELVRGFFSSSGFGDGSYSVMAHACPGKQCCDGLEIVFIDGEDDDE